MKRTVFLAVLLLLVSCLLCGCLPEIIVLPGEDSIGKAKKFEKDGITLTLTDKFEEQKSERGFDAYYVADFCGVVVLKEEFTLKEGLSEETLEEYINTVIINNGHTDITPQTKDGLWFYERTSESSYARSYCYKGSDAFCIIQFLCHPSDAKSFGDMFHLWAQSVEIG